MEAHLDKSSATSDSGGLIDLSAINSDSPASKKGELSPDEKGGGDGELPREGEGGGESSGGGGWLLDCLDLDSKLQGAKFIHEEVFDFEIPEEYLNISLDPEQPPEEDSLSLEDKGNTEPDGATSHSHQEKSAPCGDAPQPPVQSKRRELCLVDIESEPSASGSSTESHHPCIAEMNGPPLIAESLENSFKEEHQETCENISEDASCERRSDSADSGVFGIRSESSQTHLEDEGLRPINLPMVEEIPSNCCSSDLISFAPGGFPKTENKLAENSCGCEQSCAQETGNGVLGMEDECISAAAELPLEKTSDVPASVCVQSDCNQPPPSVLRLEQECSNIGVGREARLTASSSGVGREVEERRKCSRLPTPNKQLRKCSTFNRSPVKCSLMEELKEVSRDMTEFDLQSHLDLPSTTFILPKPEETTKPSAGNGLGQSEESAPLVSGSVGPIGTDPAPENWCAKRKVPKPSKRSSLLPSKPTSAIPNCKVPVPRRPADKPLTKPNLLPKSGSSQLPSRLQPKFKIPTSTSTTFRDHTNLRPRQEERSKIAPPTKPLKALGHVTSTTNTLKAPAGTRTQFTGVRSRVPQVGTRNGQKSKLHAPHTTRRSSNPAVGSQDACVQSATSTSLSTSLVYSASPQQSTPIKSAKKTPTRRSVMTPKNPNSTPEFPHAKFSLSSIEGSATPSCKEPRVREPPRTNETYTVGPVREGSGSTGGVQTPQSNKRKRRSFIPTPGGQNRLVSPVPYNPSSPCESFPHCEKKSMPPPKTRRLLNPRVRPAGLQRRGRGGMGRGTTRMEGPMKAKRTFAFGGYDFESELPVPRARVVHSPVDKENRPATPHSEWSPIRRKKPLTLEEASIQCTKRVHH